MGYAHNEGWKRTSFPDPELFYIVGWTRLLCPTISGIRVDTKSVSTLRLIREKFLFSYKLPWAPPTTKHENREYHPKREQQEISMNHRRFFRLPEAPIRMTSRFLFDFVCVFPLCLSVFVWDLFFYSLVLFSCKSFKPHFIRIDVVMHSPQN